MDEDSTPTLKKETVLKHLNEAWARIFWIDRGCQIDDNSSRMLADYLDGRRMVGFLLAESLFEEIREGVPVFVPDYCYSYLESLSLDEYKQLRAYFTWEKNGRRTDPALGRMSQDYLEACDSIPSLTALAGRISDPTEIDPLLRHIAATNQEGNIIRRKAYWRYLSNGGDDYANYFAAREYVTDFYISSFAALQEHTPVDCNHVADLLSANGNMASAFEQYVAAVCYGAAHE